METFGEAIRRLMRERDMSQRKLAKEVPCDAAHLSRIANNKKPPSAELARALEIALNAPGQLVPLVPPSKKRRTMGTTMTRRAFDMGFAASVAPELFSRVLREAATEAMEFTRFAGATEVGQSTFDHLDAEVTYLNRARQPGLACHDVLSRVGLHLAG